MKKRMTKIALIDLNHMTVGVHNNTVPLGSGFIARYLTKTLPYNLDIRIFKNPFKFKKTLKTWMPDILGMAQYSWNSELNLYMAGGIKRDNPECVVVAGGPNLYLEPKEKLAYLKKNGMIDICVEHDGEIPFAEIVRRRLNGESLRQLRKDAPADAYSLDIDTGRLVESRAAPARLNTLDVFGPMYADGFFDEFLDEGFHPFLQTQRGCPFRCTYCHTGNSFYSRIIFQSPGIFRRDMEYLGKRYAGDHNILLYLANTNFGLYPQDMEIAGAIGNIQRKYDWPKNINVNSGSNPKKVLDLLALLKYKLIPCIALQTLTPGVLSKINRKNIPFKDFVSFQKEVVKIVGGNTQTELILSLPGETKRSFLKTLSQTLDSGVQYIDIYTLVSLKGTPLALPQARDRYSHLIRHRLVPRDFSEIDGTKIFETEEAVVGTGDMPFEDYLELRGLCLVVSTFLSSIETFPIRRLLSEQGIRMSEWIFGIYKRLKYQPDVYSVYKAFLRETKDELFGSRKALIKFFSKKENYALLLSGKKGDNLLRKYKTIMLSRNYGGCLKLAVSESRRLILKRSSGKAIETMVRDLELFLSTRDVGDIFEKGYGAERHLEAALDYDVPSWIAAGSGSYLKDYKGHFKYSVTVTRYMRDRLRTFMRMNRDPVLSIQILYRDGYIKDFWPVWIRNDSRTGAPLARSL